MRTAHLIRLPLKFVIANLIYQLQSDINDCGQGLGQYSPRRSLPRQINNARRQLRAHINIKSRVTLRAQLSMGLRAKWSNCRNVATSPWRSYVASTVWEWSTVLDK
ncbi:hypothetical protein J6590_013549 [Homalodisca vitripennis]|nr:hypothetical protein J6590_013549 [Homalodisca vitripennis]